MKRVAWTDVQVHQDYKAYYHIRADGCCRAMITQHVRLIYQPRTPTITLPLFVFHLILLSSSY